MANLRISAGNFMPSQYIAATGSGTDTDPFALTVTSSASVITTGTILSLQTSATGTTFVNFPSQTCKQLDIVNTSGADIEYRRGGTGNTITVPNNSGRTILGITNASDISIRRLDTSNTQVTVKAEALG